MQPQPAPAPTKADLAAPAALPDDVQRDKLALIGQMASSVAHELSNPLATIVATTQAILNFWPRPGLPGAPTGNSRDGWAAPPEFTSPGAPLRQLREDLEMILTEARRAGDIVHGLLNSARHHPPEYCIYSLADVVRRTVGLCRHHLKLHNISLQSPLFEPGEALPLWSRMRGDANQLQQVLLNLVINAQQAISSSRGYGTVRITMGPDGPDRIMLTVEDDGPGVPAGLRDVIFQPFYTTKPPGQGTGLGLSISAGIVRAHGGEIRVDDHPSGGAIFRLVLPSLAASERASSSRQLTPASAIDALPALTPSAQPASAAPAAAPAILGRVLLVDDESGIRRSVSRFLGRYGFQVTDVGSGQAAIAALAAGPFDAIISDLRMPGLSGEQFYEEVKRQFPAMARH
ncbi:MAG TPA: ATP-binding protein, partial [Gemmatimonadales bacterium]|nr:ATP-binding protein [Gemmatimonadales bacterium]